MRRQIVFFKIFSNKVKTAEYCGQVVSTDDDYPPLMWSVLERETFGWHGWQPWAGFFDMHCNLMLITIFCLPPVPPPEPLGSIANLLLSFLSVFD